MLNAVNWHIYLLTWVNFVVNWTCHCQRNSRVPHSSSIEDAFWIKIVCRQAVRVWRMQLCSIICKKYWDAECPLALKNWELAVHLACNYPCSLTSPRKLTKLPPQTDWWTAKPTRQKAFQIAFPSREVRGTVYRVEFSHLCIQCCVRATNISVSTILTYTAFEGLKHYMLWSHVSIFFIFFIFGNFGKSFGMGVGQMLLCKKPKPSPDLF